MMEPTKIIFALFFTLIFKGHVYSYSVNIHPKTATGIVGGEVSINCEVEFGPNLEMTWDFNRVFLYIVTIGKEQYPLGTSKYSVHKTGMNFTLIIKDLRLEDWGKYICTSYKSEDTAMLVVLDTPSITMNPPAPLEGETAMVTCEARFGGPKKDLISPGHYPSLKMYLNESTLNEMVTAKDTSNAQKYYLISMTKNLTVHASMNKRHITCEIGTAEPIIDASAVAELNVIYSVRDIHVAPDQDIYNVGDNISCIVDSNPAAIYEWAKVQGGRKIYGKWLKITDTMIGENNWECVARNFINGEWFQDILQSNFVAVDPNIYANDSAAVTNAVDSSTSGNGEGNDISPVTIAVVTVIIIILVIIAAVAFIFRKKMKKPKGSSTKGNANNLQELGSVEAEQLLPTIQQEKDGSSAPENSIEKNNPQRSDGSGSSENEIMVRIQEQQSDVTKLLQPTIRHEKDGSGASEHSIEPNIQQGKDGSDSPKHSIEQNIPQRNDGSGSSANSIKPTIQQEKDGASAPEHSIQPTIQQEKDGASAPEHSIQKNIPQGRDGPGASGRTTMPNIPQAKDGSDESKHSFKDEKTKAPKLGSLQCIQLLNSVNNKENLDQHGKEILRVLQEDRKSILEKDPNILMVLIKNTDKLIDSEYYEDIIKVAPHGGEDSPLKSLLDILSDEGRLKIIMKYQNKLFSVIKIISSCGDVQYRTECLKYIIVKRTFGRRGYSFEWSEEYLSTVKDLLEKGADPTWISPEELEKERRYRTTAQNEFFEKIFVNLWEKNDLHESLLGVLPLMLSKKSNNNKILHYFVGDYNRWKYIATNRESMPRDFFRQFQNILREILIHDGTLLVQKECYRGRTPLQLFLWRIKLEERIFGEVREIIQMLQSPQVLSSQDKYGWTALHYLADEFPVIRGEVTQNGRESFLELVKSFANESNVGCQSKYGGRTALHWLARKFPGISEEWREVYQDFVKHLSSYDILEIKDKDKYGGRTALHYLADGFTFEIKDWRMETIVEIEEWKMETFMEVLKCLAVPRTIRIKDDYHRETALEIISRKWGKKFLRPNKVPEHYKDKFQEILDILSGNN